MLTKYWKSLFWGEKIVNCCENVEFEAVQKCANIADLKTQYKKGIHLQKSASIQPRPNPLKSSASILMFSNPLESDDLQII